MQKLLAAAALTLGATGCLGPNNAARSLLNWNATATEYDLANEAIFIGLVWVPVYELALLGDVLVFNTIEHWSGENPIDAPGPFPGFTRGQGEDDD